jgi:hypothetical protein
VELAASFFDALPDDKKQEINRLDSPLKIQLFIDSIPYRPEDDNYCPLSVFRDGKAHCFDGGLLAATCLEKLGHPPIIVQMLPWNDDDHILAIYKRNGRFGAVAKSNFVGLRMREPVYASIHELIMSYFDVYYSMDGDFTLRGYSAPLRLNTYDPNNWRCSDNGAQKIAERLPQLRQYSLLTDSMIRDLGKVNPLTFQANMLNTIPEGLYDPNKHKNH